MTLFDACLLLYNINMIQQYKYLIYSLLLAALVCSPAGLHAQNTKNTVKALSHGLKNAAAQDVAKNTYLAAMEDSRFSPLTQDELKDLSFSVSLLTGFEPIIYKNSEDLLSQIKAGIDGIIIRDGDRQGLFLPSVWQELPDKEEFMKQLKIKAGINPSYWSENLKVYRFRTVEIKSNEN